MTINFALNWFREDFFLIMQVLRAILYLNNQILTFQESPHYLDPKNRDKSPPKFLPISLKLVNYFFKNCQLSDKKQQKFSFNIFQKKLLG